MTRILNVFFNSKKMDFYTNRLTFYQQQISARQQQKNPKATYRALGTFLPQLKIWQTCNITLLP